MYMLESAIRDRIRLSVSINCKFGNFCENFIFANNIKKAYLRRSNFATKEWLKTE